MELIKGENYMAQNADYLLSQLENERNKKKMPKEVFKLVLFTRENKIIKAIDTKIPSFKIHKQDDGYIFNYNNKDYYFEILSEKKVLLTDKKNLRNYKKRIEKFLERSLRIAGSNELLGQKLLFISSDILGVNCIVEYTKDGVSRVVDYSNNLIMKKEDYFSLFDVEVINTLDKEVLYRYYENMDYLDDISLMYILLAGEEIMDTVEKKFRNDNEYLRPNKENDKILGADNDGIFLTEEDFEENVMDIEIDSFTLNNKENHHIKKDNDEYYYKKNLLARKVYFNLFSSVVEVPEIREELHSEERYGHCHFNSKAILNSISKDSYDEAYVVSGKVRLNKYQYVYHSWVEISVNNKTIVIDYNRNLIMGKKDYYNMKKPVIINKTDMDTINKLEEYERALLPLPCNLELYFSKEILKDLEKNKCLFKK